MESASSIIEKSNRADLLIISTAGSVDDGKSTLIGRLLSDCKAVYEDQLQAAEKASKRLNRDEVDLALLTDGLKAEREQGITIDVAYRYFSTPKRRFIIADTPGHEQYTRNMVTGASNANLAIVLIDARHGVLTQSKRHGFIASLLGIPHVAVCINKMDLVDFSEDVFEQIRQDFSDFSAKLKIPDLHFFPISALNGDNVVEPSEQTPWYNGPALLEFLESVHIAGDRNLIDLRFPVQWVNRPNQDFRGFSGTIDSGIVRVGDEVSVLPSGKTTKVKSIHTYTGELEMAFAPQAVTLCLEDEVDTSRGDMIVHLGNQAKVRSSIESMLVWMDEAPMKIGHPYLIKSGTQTVKATIERLRYRLDPNNLHRDDAPELGLNDIGRVSIECHRPLIFDAYSKNRRTGSFIIIDPATYSTVGAGMILDRQSGADESSTEKPKSKNIRREQSEVTAQQRSALLGQKACTIWLTGLSGSGKSTIGKVLESALIEAGRPVYLLDGDNIRHGISRDLGFSQADRDENIRRISHVAKLFNEAGVIVITSFISPYRASRIEAASIVGRERFFEMYVSTPLDVCETRDPKGLYKKVRAGEIPNFTGVTDPYEAPADPCVSLPTHELDLSACVDRCMAFILPNISTEA